MTQSPDFVAKLAKEKTHSLNDKLLLPTRLGPKDIQDNPTMVEQIRSTLAVLQESNDPVQTALFIHRLAGTPFEEMCKLLHLGERAAEQRLQNLCGMVGAIEKGTLPPRGK